MAVTSCVKQRGSSETTVEKGNRRSHRAAYAITTNAQHDPYVAAEQATAIGPDPLPHTWSNHPADPYAWVRSITVTQHADHNFRFDARVEWKTLEANEQPPDQQGGGQTNPLLLPVKYSMEFDTRTEVKAKAWAQTTLTYPSIGIGDETNIVNGAGQDYDEPLVDEITDAVLVMQKNYASLTTIHTIHRAFSGTTNSAAFLGYAKHHCKYQTPSVSEIQYQNDIEYYTARWRILLSGVELYHEIVNRGLMAVDANGNLTKAKEEKGNEATEPMNLELDGTQTAWGAKGTSIKYRTLKDASYTFWTTFNTADVP